MIMYSYLILVTEASLNPKALYAEDVIVLPHSHNLMGRLSEMTEKRLGAHEGLDTNFQTSGCH